jgi:hypothetical protein
VTQRVMLFGRIIAFLPSGPSATGQRSAAEIPE